MARLHYDAKNLIGLIKRSDDISDGWRKVSGVLEHHVKHVISSAPELFELVEYNDGTARVRLTERGNIVADYL